MTNVKTHILIAWLLLIVGLWFAIGPTAGLIAIVLFFGAQVVN